MTLSVAFQSFRKSTLTESKFSILIPTWNNLSYLKLCIESIRKNSVYTHQIIVHANESADGTQEWLQEQLDVSYTYSRENIGVCYALNCARTLAQTEYILYLNDDMYVCPGWDKALDEEIKKVGHKYFFLSATAIEPRAQSRCSIEKNYGTAIDNFDEQQLLKDFEALPINDWQGATWPPNVVHKDIWDIVGGYSVEFSPGMYSDPDFSMKLWQAGVRLFKGLSKSRVYHFGSVSVKRVNKNKGYYTFIGKWGITSSTLSKYYLRRGEIFDGPLTMPKIGILLRIKNLIKRINAAFAK